MDLNPYKLGSPTKSQKTSIQQTYNQDRTWSNIAITDYIHSSQNTVLQHIGVQMKLLQTSLVAEAK